MHHGKEHLAVMSILLVSVVVFYLATPTITGLAIENKCDSGVKSYCSSSNEYYLCSEEGRLGPYKCSNECEDLHINSKRIAFCN